ncbi:transposase [Mesorhizobium escarrei]|uniref:transposase n=1 Tax=Mesorhizobium escarrei TaxID=666018 RepID=UPI00345B7890
MFKILVLQALYRLSDDQAEFQIMDRRTFGRLLACPTVVTNCRHPHDLAVSRTSRLGQGDRTSVRSLPRSARPIIGVCPLHLKRHRPGIYSTKM